MGQKDQELVQYTHTWPEAVRTILSEKEQDALTSLKQYQQEIEEIWRESKKDHPLLRRFQRDAKQRRLDAAAAAKQKAKEAGSKKIKAKWLALANALAVYDTFAMGVMKFNEEVERAMRSKDPIAQVEIELRNKLKVQRWFNL